MKTKKVLDVLFEELNKGQQGNWVSLKTKPREIKEKKQTHRPYDKANGWKLVRFI